MNSDNLPTKNNLMRLKENLRLSKQGHDLLDKKKLILAMEQSKFLEKAKSKKEELLKEMQEAKSAYVKSIIEVGTDRIIDISNGIPIDKNIDIKYKSIMGVEIPSIVYEEEKIELNYSLLDTTSSVDKTIIICKKIKKLLIEYAEIINIIQKLETNIEKVSKRSNALSDLIIPQTEENVKDISDILEEREREEFTRLKIIKGKMN